MDLVGEGLDRVAQEGCSVHLAGLVVERDEGELRDAVELSRRHRSRRRCRCRDRFDVGKYGSGGSIGRWHWLVAGGAIGAGNGEVVGGTLQARYDTVYTQCMTAKGNRIGGPYIADLVYVSPPPYYRVLGIIFLMAGSRKRRSTDPSTLAQS
jgi:hypothetical protein